MLSLIKCSLLRFAIVLSLGMAGLSTAQASQSNDNIYLYRSPITHAFFEANGTSYDTLLAKWKTYLKPYGQVFQQATRANLLAGLKPGVLVLGSAVLLDAQERAAIKAYADAGGNIMVTWGTGARDGRGQWAGYGFIEELMDAKIAGSVTRAQEEWFLNPFGNSPITWSLPAGKRIFLGKTAETPLRISATQISARYLDWARSPDITQATGAIAYREKGVSRRVFIGFSESNWEFDAGQDLYIMLDSIFSWLRHKPSIVKANWPQGYLAAQLLEMDTEDGFKNAEHFASDLDSFNARGTFYCLTSIARKNRDLVNALAVKHEIGYHGDVHVGFKGKTAQEHDKRFKTMTEQMQEIVGTDALARSTGFRAPTESFDRTTYQSMRTFGLQHNVAGPDDSEARLPYFITQEQNRGPQDAIVALPRTQRDDLNYRAAKLSDAQSQALIVKEFDYVLEMGALGLLSVHSQNYGPDGLMTKLTPFYLRRIQENRQNVWVASGDQIASWWRARESVTLKSSSETLGKTLAFSVGAPGKVKGVSFIIIHPQTDTPPKSLIATTAGQPQPLLKRIDAFRTAVFFDQLETGNYEYGIQY